MSLYVLPTGVQKKDGTNVLFLRPKNVISTADNRSVNKQLVQTGFEVVMLL